MKRIYLDSNILISYFSPDKTEEIKNNLSPTRWLFSLN
jgi:hypothetical protein